MRLFGAADTSSINNGGITIAKKSTRLDSYFANVSARRRSVADWRIYAAVTGSAMAMATNASAGVIYFNQAVTVGPIANVARSSATLAIQGIDLQTAMGGYLGANFRVGVYQRFGSSGSQAGQAFFRAGGGSFAVLAATGVGLKKFASGANISTAPGQWLNTAALASRSGSNSVVNRAAGWAASATGFAGFRFSTTANHALDYGWVRLSYTVGTNGLPNSITATDWGYDPTGAAVTAGETSTSATPEPSTAALAILAAGAAGVAALRRCTHALNQ